MGTLDHLRRAQLDSTAQKVRDISGFGVPPQGWIRTVREALGMSIRQLAERTGLSKSSVAAFEKRETSGAITLDSLRRMADALESDLRYAIVPRRPLDEVLETRAREVAERVVEDLNRRMEFEMREIPEEELRAMVQLHTRRALEAPHRLWDD